ncbi:MAG TPA: divalent-cation tolerance protein CutA [Spirochaetota bacterium]|nr:divalent-cation tolerance protein CutA [Spirochaetota bacterium]HPQ48439.1 divalent-cation tolerance protein CutA [Spirochaetota bacterium]
MFINKKGFIVISTVDTIDKARDISQKIIENKLAGCVSILPNIESKYYWENRVEVASEFLLIIKTTKERVKKLVKYIKTIHPYSVPEIAVVKTLFDISYFNWLKSYVGKD